MSRKSEIIPIDRRQGHTLDFEFVPRANNHDEIFVVVDGRRIASRGQPGTPEAGIWVSIVPGYTVLDNMDDSAALAATLRAIYESFELPR